MSSSLNRLSSLSLISGWRTSTVHVDFLSLVSALSPLVADRRSVSDAVSINVNEICILVVAADRTAEVVFAATADLTLPVTAVSISITPVGAVTLAVVRGVSDWSGPSFVVDKTYKFTDQATAKNPFEAAKKAGDIEAYAFNGSGYFDSIATASGVEIKMSSDRSPFDRSSRTAVRQVSTKASPARAKTSMS